MMFMLSTDWEIRLSTRVAIWSETSRSQFRARCSVAFWIARPFIKNSVPVTTIAMLRPNIVRSTPFRYWLMVCSFFILFTIRKCGQNCRTHIL